MQLGASGVTHDPDFAQKKEARAKRFQLEGQLPEPSYNDVQQMYDSPGLNKKEYRLHAVMVHEGDVNQPDSSEGLKQILSAMNAHTTNLVVSTPISHLLLCMEERFEFSHNYDNNLRQTNSIIYWIKNLKLTHWNNEKTTTANGDDD